MMGLFELTAKTLEAMEARQEIAADAAVTAAEEGKIIPAEVVKYDELAACRNVTNDLLVALGPLNADSRVRVLRAVAAFYNISGEELD
jgi:hypothetical protein